MQNTISPFSKHALVCAGLYVDLDDIYWTPDWLEQRWTRMLTAKAEIDRDWKLEQQRRLDEIAKIIEADKRSIALDLLHEEADERLRRSRLEEADIEKRYLEEAFKVEQRIAARHHAARWDRVKKAGREIDRDVVRAERAKLSVRGRR